MYFGGQSFLGKLGVVSGMVLCADVSAGEDISS